MSNTLNILNRHFFFLSDFFQQFLGQAEANYDHSQENILFDAKFSGDVDEHENYAGFLNFSNQPTSGTENNAMPSRTIIFDCGTEQDFLFYHLHGHDYDMLDHPHGHDYDKDEGDDLMDAPWNRNYEPIETKKDIEKRSLKSNLTYSPNSFHLDFACKKNSFFKDRDTWRINRFYTLK